MKSIAKGERFLNGYSVSSWVSEEPDGISEFPLVENLVFSAMSVV